MTHEKHRVRKPRCSAARRCAASVALLLAGVSFAGSASAGHAPLVPEPRTILVQPNDPSHVVIGARRGGYFVTRDAGQSWHWMCEAAVGYDDEEVYPGALLPSGKILVSTGFGGISSSADGCGWTPWAPSPTPFVADLRVAPSSEVSVVLLEARADGAGFANQLWRSDQDADEWQALGAAFAPDTLAVSLALSSNGAIYVATTGPAGAELLRSEDGAQSWVRSSITADAAAVPRLVGASPTPFGPTRVYVVLDYPQAEGITSLGDRVLMSADGGASFVPLLEGQADLAASALSVDGDKLAVGGHLDGLYVLLGAAAAAAPTALSQASPSSVHVLAWDAEGRLYAAGHEAIDGFSIGVSSDDGRTFAPLLALCQVQGPLACAPETSVGQLCLSAGETGWDVRKEAYPSPLCEVGAMPQDGDVSEGTPGGSATPAPSATDDAAAAEQGGGCSVTTRRPPPGQGRLAATLTLAGALALAVGLRGRRRHPR